MSLLLAAAATLYLNTQSGQLAGMNNTILDPRYSLGIRGDYTPHPYPDWSTRYDIYGIYGSVEAGNGKFGPAWQEIRSTLDSSYEVYSKDKITRAGIGIYAETAIPMHAHMPYLAQNGENSYTAEEGEQLSRELAWGLNLKVAFSYDRLASEFDNVFFVNGSRVGANLMTYQPLLELKWNNTGYLIGDKEHPKLRMFSQMQFYFARKSGVAVFNTHDGLGGTKRELYIGYGLGYSPTDKVEITLQSYGYNNLNRGTSNTLPQGFRDGFIMGLNVGF